MKIKGILFDINGTLIDIHTDEGMDEIYRAVSHFLTYQGIYLHRGEVRDQYFRIMEEQTKASGEEHPEFDAVELWREFLEMNRNPAWLSRSDRTEVLPRFLAEMYRGISRHRLELYPDVKSVLGELKPRYSLAVVSDGQSVWALPEMRAMGLDSYFDPIVISSDYGFRKPDQRLFQAALHGIGAGPEEVLFVGNDMYHDIFGARQIGMKTVFFTSNQGRQHMEGVEADYIIYRIAELRQAVKFFERL
ncbi:MAG: HAD family hydrolase [Desulfobacterota bacterium]|jgi:putative hydrolase of the HAD superfamily|nr:HAD family hydrolase [Thermodesulfobacteriota bacterium]